MSFFKRLRDWAAGKYREKYLESRCVNLKCPHCNSHGVSASKILHFGPAWSFRCSVCQRKHKASYWFLPLTLVTALAVSFVVMTSLTKVS